MEKDQGGEAPQDRRQRPGDTGRGAYTPRSESTFAFTKPCDSIMVDFFARSFPDEFGKRKGEIELI